MSARIPIALVREPTLNATQVLHVQTHAHVMCTALTTGDGK